MQYLNGNIICLFYTYKMEKEREKRAQQDFFRKGYPQKFSSENLVESFLCELYFQQFKSWIKISIIKLGEELTTWLKFMKSGGKC